MKTTKKTAPKTKAVKIALPAGIVDADLKYVSPAGKAGQTWKQYEKSPDRMIAQFEIWNTERFGWCIPTLHIRNPGRNAAAGVIRRTYATAIASASTVRIGLGPHVKEHFTVYVTNGTKARLQKFLDMQATGEGAANDIRDTISTRRMRSAGRSGYSSLSRWF